MALPYPRIAERERIVREICHSDSHNVNNTHFDPFMRFYTSILHNRENIFSVDLHESVFKTHADVMEAIFFLRRSGNLAKSSFQDQIFGDADGLEKDYAARITAKAGFMIDCASKDDFSKNYQRYSSFPVKWSADQSFTEFLEAAFPPTNSCTFHAGSSIRSMKAWKLKRRNGIRFVPTNDLVQHLLYDRQASTVKIFHQAAFIKAQLWHTRYLPLNTGFGESVQRYVESSQSWATQSLK